MIVKTDCGNDGSFYSTSTGTASGSFSSPIGNMYVSKHFNERAKHAMEEMVRDIRGEFDNILSEIDWMDDETRTRAKDKLKTMKEYIGYPEEILVERNLEELYEKLSVGAESHFLNGINMSVWGTNYAWGKLREKVERNSFYCLRSRPISPNVVC